MKLISKQCGLSLIEIMVALVISLFLLGGIIQVYMGNKSAYGFSDAISRIQENGRFALDTITSDVRMAGFMGCMPVQEDKDGDGQYTDDNPFIQNHLNPANYSANKYKFFDSPAISVTDNLIANGSDSLLLKGVRAGQSAFLADLSMPGSGAITVDSSVAFSANDIVLITNCFSADVFQIGTVTTDDDAGTTTLTHVTGGESPGNINLDKNPCTSPAHCLINKNESPFYANRATAFRMQVVRYYLATPADSEPVLHRVVNETDEELIEGVEQMQIMFGIDTDSDGFANLYLDGTDVPNMNQVKAIRIALVVRSDQTGLTESNQSYQIFDNDVTANDTRLRQVFTSTITLRNFRK